MMFYRPLERSKRGIRLLRVLPGPGAAQDDATPPGEAPVSDIVSCKLQHYSLDDAASKTPKTPLDWSDGTEAWRPTQGGGNRFPWGDFVALSYMWGEAKPTREILLNGSIVKVRANLDEALRALRAKRLMRCGLLIWIDALCINQNDQAERETEVERMRSIYQAARDVVIWLGPEESGDGAAMGLLRAMAASVAEGSQEALELSLRRQSDLFGAGSWRALGQLLNKRYWNRLWVMQEISMGRAESPVLCGDQMITWGEIYHGVVTFGQRIDDLMFFHVEKETKEAGLVYRGLNRLKFTHLWLEQEVQAGAGLNHYMSMLDLARKSYVSEPRDRVYGILGIIPREVADLVDVDYDMELAQVFTSFTRNWISATNSLEILEQCSTTSADRPSWVPGLDAWHHVRLFSGSPCFYAAQGLRRSISFSDQGRRLVTEAVLVGVVDGLGTSYHENPQPMEPSDELVQTRSAASAYGSGDGDLARAVWQTLTGNRDPDGGPAPAAYRRLLACAFPPDDGRAAGLWRGRRAFQRVVWPNRHLRIGGRALRSFFPAHDRPPGVSDSPLCKRAFERMFRFHRARRLMVTAAGHLGLAPHAAQRGDCVFVLSGCDVPMAARPRPEPDGSFQLIGGCYLQGFMEGELARDRGDADLGWQTVVFS